MFYNNIAVTWTPFLMVWMGVTQNDDPSFRDSGLSVKMYSVLAGGLTFSTQALLRPGWVFYLQFILVLLSHTNSLFYCAFGMIDRQTDKYLFLMIHR